MDVNRFWMHAAAPGGASTFDASQGSMSFTIKSGKACNRKKGLYLRMCEASSWHCVVVQDMLTPTYVLNSADALRTGSMRQHVLACNATPIFGNLHSYVTEWRTRELRMAR